MQNRSYHVIEQELIEKLKKGDQAAFRFMVTSWQDMVYNTSLGLVQNEMDAEDVTQEVFVKAFESIHGFKGESKVSTWLYRITVTKSLDFLRSKKRKKRFGYIYSLFGEDNELAINPPEFVHPGIVSEKKQVAAALFKALETLPEQQRVAFVLTRLEGLGHKEVSEVMGNTVPAVESLLQRAKINLKKQLSDFYRQNLE
ncbi:MAG: RNA polymerase sigma factor [Bacteroidetes bacterium]|uniref:RNA polymerase sigma factor n=1 Tax=Phnomibacter sp. TaxID=2836217 RepID=UPI002FDE1142|nr:RNA polymerase sigma factor [Bacteroidota bacterium]